ncbi:hypothetical protein CEXT_630431 [Caerostris extrusa]|uniref:Uncharacterized protein n=1 Tax=Caerostris extrusa TaxID=172846 RepID=A0AAV4V9C0_CAEEX|nr:hypothetical protein CEXT_630431 [Caerostris extrusa]
MIRGSLTEPRRKPNHDDVIWGFFLSVKLVDLALYKALAKGGNFYALVSLQTRANLSPFTKDYRGEEQINELQPIFGTPFRWG